jgi:hypothetical protein
MVREARFAFDDDFEDSNPHPNEDFTEEDDRFLDAFSPPEAPARRSQQGKTKTRGKPEQERKHLSDADWLSPKSPPRSRRRKPA